VDNDDFPGGCLGEFAAELVFGGAISAGVTGIAIAFRSHPIITTACVLAGLSLIGLVGWAIAKRRGRASPRLAGAGVVGLLLLAVVFVMLEALS